MTKIQFCIIKKVAVRKKMRIIDLYNLEMVTKQLCNHFFISISYHLDCKEKGRESTMEDKLMFMYDKQIPSKNDIVEGGKGRSAVRQYNFILTYSV